MMMTEKYYTLPSSFYYSTIYHSPTKNRLDFQKKTSTNMKLLFEQQPILQTHSLYDIHQHIDDFEKNSKDKGN
jgi:hypothetical protein